MVVVVFAGEFDVAQAERLNDVLAVAAKAESVVLDLSSVTYMDSTMLNALVTFRRRRAELGYHDHVPIEGAGPLIRRLFSLVHLDKIFALRPEPAPRPAQVTKIHVLGRDLPKSRSAEEFSYALDRVVCDGLDGRARREADGGLRWVREGRQCQVHCVSDRELVVLQMHHEGGPGWAVDDMRKISIDEVSPWSEAESVVGYLTGRTVAAL